jgi:hypothetical protein
MADNDLQNGFFERISDGCDPDEYSQMFFDAAYASIDNLREAQVGPASAGPSDLGPDTDSIVETQNRDTLATTHQETGQISDSSSYVPSSDIFEQNLEGNFPHPMENTNNTGVSSEASHRQNPFEGVHSPTTGTGFDTASFARIDTLGPITGPQGLPLTSFTPMQHDPLSQELNEMGGGGTPPMPLGMQWERTVRGAPMISRQQTDEPWCSLMVTLPLQSRYTQVDYEGSSGQLNQPNPWNEQPIQMPNTPSIVASYQPDHRIQSADGVNLNPNSSVLYYGSLQNPSTNRTPSGIAFNGIATNNQPSDSLGLDVFTMFVRLCHTCR